MTAHVTRALRVIAPSDWRLIWRDGFMLVFLMAVLPLATVCLRWLLPYVADLVREWVELERYYGVILGYMLGQQPVLLGGVVGILFIEERDRGTLLAIRATPLSLDRFVGYRLLAAMAITVVSMSIAVPLSGLAPVPLPALLAATTTAALAAPIVALFYAVYFRNKVQAVTALKLVQGWAGLPAFLFFAPTPWEWIGSVVGPLYYPMRLFWTAADGRPEWWLVVPALVVQGAAIAWLHRRLRRVVFG